MSHLPLDARAILDYLNELGYRNISADQLKEFMKGMQSQSEIYKSKLKEKNSNSPQQSQRREQQRQQQPLQSTTSATTKPTTAEGSEAAVVGVGKSTPLPQRRATVKVIKCKKPLCHFKFYLDICDHQLTKRIEEQIRKLGGALEFFLTSSVTHFITDKAILPPIVANNNNNNSLSSRPGTPQTPSTPNTPQTPYTFDTQDGKNNVCGGSNTPTGSARKINTRQTRANTILNRVRRASTSTNTLNAVSVSEPPNSPIPVSFKDLGKQSPIVSTQSPYIVWQTEYALHFFKKVQHELKDYLGVHSRHDQQKLLGKGRNTVDPIDLKGGGFIKIEAVKHNYRPYYQLFRKSSGTEWPKIELTREDGAFRLSPKKKVTPSAEVIAEAKEREKEKAKTGGNEDQNMTRKSRSRSSQHQRPLHAAVQSLKKGAGGGGGAAADSAATVKSSQRNSNAGGAVGGVPAGCKQAKESSEKQCGVCEICKIEYDTLTIHLKTKDHEYFAKNSQNFIALDSLIHTSADLNKFLDEDKKVDLEEMEVENIEVVADVNAPDPLEGSEPLVCTPLLDRMSGGLLQTPSPTLREKSKRSTKGKHSSEKFQNIRPSKSPKASATAVKSQTSPLKQQLALTTTTTSSMLELQRIGTQTCTTTTANAPKSTALTLSCVAAAAAVAVPTRRKPASAVALSPPIRAMLPPSSLYKVVGTPETGCTPVRKARGDLPSAGDQAVTASPSLIVKFKKVRSTELNRLNGEAESFMFPKQRTSSELPTDVDRQTTSDNIRASSSSTSLDSTSDGPMDVESVATAVHDSKSLEGGKPVAKRATATAKRRKSQVTAVTMQRFRTAPIQPAIQLKDKQTSRQTADAKPPKGNTADTAKAAFSAAAAKANAAAAALAAITLPEATRKSSRTATAIVTAATTSSRLLRAAVEAAKHNCRQMAAANDLLGNVSKYCCTNEGMTKALSAAAVTATATASKARKRVPVVKMEDRMGDAGNDKKLRELKKDESTSDDKEDDTDDDASSSVNNGKNVDDYDEDSKNNFVADLDEDNDDDDDDDDDDEEVDNDDEKDEDYIHCKSSRRKSVLFNSFSAVWQSGCSGATSRKQRAAQREEQKSKLAILSVGERDNLVTKNAVGGTGRGTKRKKCNSEQSTPLKQNTITDGNSKSSKTATASVTPAPMPMATLTPSPPKQRIIELGCDYTKSERLNRMRYSFERLPVTDLWYRVFTRQDNISERFFEYYGSKNYRKLPYELGPIPFARTLDIGVCCKLCEKQRSSDFSAKEVVKGSLNSPNSYKIKTEPTEGSATGATKSRDSSNGNSNGITNATSSCATENDSNVQSTPPSTHSSATSAAAVYKHKHKKLQILQRYRQEQQELQKRKAEQVCAQLGDNELQCDSKATTPAQERTRDRQRAGSTHSTTSSTSCASSTATTKTNKNRYLNKHLNKAAAVFLNLELPPRKSPREHASTLALVSCIIKQRQDSQSRPNSETDEPSATPTPVSVAETPSATTSGITTSFAINSASISGAVEVASASEPGGSAKVGTPISEMSAVLRSPRHTRSAAATPVEELRFTTEISENVKRMRRGQNKYDHSPPVALTHSAKSRKSMRGGRQTLKSPLGRPPRAYCGLQKFLHTTGHSTNSRSQTPNALGASSTETAKRRRRTKHADGFAVATHATRRNHSYSGLLAQGSALPSIRKTGSKKGVLEFEVDATALKALDAATKHTNVRQLEWQIDKYLQFHGSEYDLEENVVLPLSISEGGEIVSFEAATTSAKRNNTTASATSASTSKALRRVGATIGDAKRNSSSSVATLDSNTPPPTDCFSSDFDLYDLFTNTMGGSASDDEPTPDVGRRRRGKGFSLYSSLSMQNYFRKRKSLKCNRTGWPKVQKKKSSARQQQLLAQKIRFLQDIGELTSNGFKEGPDGDGSKEDDRTASDGDSAVKGRDGPRRRENGAITPPESEAEVKLFGKLPMQSDAVGDADEEEAVADDGTELDADGIIREEEEEEEEMPDELEEDDDEDDDETMADSMEEAEVRDEHDADAAAEADEEDAEDGEDGEDAEIDADGIDTAGEDEDDMMDDDSNFVSARMRTRRPIASPTEEKHVTSNSLTAHSSSSTMNNNATTSTPTTPMLRGSLRRTPQLLNGSLGSCISPSEKAGDNSDIFTVSSDGLDTDLDMSNSQHKCDDEHLHHHHHHHHHHLHHQHRQDQCANHQTPKRKFDLSKYAPNNATSSSCAAEAATAAVKSLAISQFLKKEVRVTCRRLRAPFRRYRYRR